MTAPETLLDELFRENHIPMSDRNAVIYDALRERLSASEATGGEWVLVPRVATTDMELAGCEAGYDHDGEDEAKVAVMYRAMLAATPPPPRDAGREWQPIETAPKDEYVLVSCGPGGMIEACQPAEFVGKQYPWIDSYGSAVVGPEYWMPLPAPPRALAGGG